MGHEHFGTKQIQYIGATLATASTTHQFLRKQQRCVVVTLKSPRSKPQNVFLMLLDLGQGPVLTLQALLLPFSHFLQVTEKSH